MISTAVGNDRVSRVIGYKLKAGTFDNNTPNLPQRIAIFGEANTANQATIDESVCEFVNAREVGEKYGYGSPLYMIAKILRPKSGDLIGGIPTVIYPQLEPAGAVAKEMTISVAAGGSGATKNVTHYLIVSGRNNIDGDKYAVNITEGDDANAIAVKIKDVIASILSTPVTASSATNVVTLKTKWAGLTSNELNVSVDTGNETAGIVYSIADTVAGIGEPSISNALSLFGSEWNTIVINPYGVNVWTTLEAFNGVPSVDTPTGRYNPIDFKPFVALTGSTESDKDALALITDASARKDQVTNVICPAPNSKGFSFEAAANMATTTAFVMQNEPHLGNGNKSYPDMPIPLDSNIGDFADYNARDFLVKKGCSTVLLKSGRYTVQDFVTTYHPDGENPPKFRKVRDLNIDWNIAFGWILIMERDIHDKTLIVDDSAVRVGNTISPKQAKQLVISYIENKNQIALINDVPFSIASIKTQINTSNPARLDVFFRYKRTSTADIISTDVEVDFSYSS